MTERFITPQYPDLHGYHIYLNKSKKESRRKNFILDFTPKTVHKIKLIIDWNVSNINSLFRDCHAIQEVQFIRFHRVDFKDISFMFANCKNLKKINLAKLKTNNIKEMNGMFDGCENLKKIYCSKLIANQIENKSKIQIKLI